MISLLMLAQATAQITISATVLAGCQQTITTYLDDSSAPQEDLYLSCTKGTTAVVDLGPLGPLQQAGFGLQQRTFTFEGGQTVHIPLPRANRGLFVSTNPVSQPPRNIRVTIR